MIKKISLTFFGSILLSASVSAQMYQQKMSTFLNLIDNYYVKDVNVDSLVEFGMKQMLKQLDPHSVYMNADEIKKANEPLEGNFEGVGIQFQIYNDTIQVVHVIAGGPSKKVGVQDGDKIIFVDTAKVAGIGINNDGVFKALRGKKGTKVNIRVKRFGSPELLAFEIIRDKIPIYAIGAQYMATPDIGYVKLERFSATATEETQKAIDSLKKEGAQKIILDLTGNGGGYLNQAHELSDLFLANDKLVVYSEGRSQPRIDLTATEKGNFEKGDLVIMVDQNTASASEIVSGAVQDWDRGLIVGRRTYGKGLVQKGYMLPDLSAVRLTMAYYYTPSGRNIQKPYVKGADEYKEDIEERYESGELFDSSKIKVVDSTKYYTNNKRIVYGGGGITPDIFVGLDTLWHSNFYGKLVRSGSFNQFILSYVDANRNALEIQYPSLDKFIKEFKTDSSFMQQFYAFAKQKKAVPDSAENFSQSIPTIQNQLKGLLAQNLWNSSAFYQVTNEQNPIFIRALNAFTDDSFKHYNIPNYVKPTVPKKIKFKKRKKYKLRK
ncbi:MAG TPA: S41 family peptidase [Chitinophagales bacterium]|jgi:carboxyl-terminal processing protease|nr:S41 family peptidase [Chitinophagales bacterium]MBP6154625.1 S41 family peptidase [Chitinophagales bacterium]HQV77171.1 S41 family peptidase [Chitinophagales bacterium]HQW79670.1 S41 family peptidase [Chitinophagales bacterium]